jgi:hypothetical protein
MNDFGKLHASSGQCVLHRISASCPLPIEWSAVVAADQPCPLEVCAVTIGQLRSALRDDRAEIVVIRPSWLPASLFVLAVMLVLLANGLLLSRGLFLGYNIELCQRLSVKGTEISNCLQLTKPRP